MHHQPVHQPGRRELRQDPTGLAGAPGQHWPLQPLRPCLLQYRRGIFGEIREPRQSPVASRFAGTTLVICKDGVALREEPHGPEIERGLGRGTRAVDHQHGPSARQIRRNSQLRRNGEGPGYRGEGTSGDGDGLQSSCPHSEAFPVHAQGFKRRAASVEGAGKRPAFSTAGGQRADDGAAVVEGEQAGPELRKGADPEGPLCVAPQAARWDCCGRGASFRRQQGGCASQGVSAVHWRYPNPLKRRSTRHPNCSGSAPATGWASQPRTAPAHRSTSAADVLTGSTEAEIRPIAWMLTR